jgi:osmotically-inducible protein OsmY
MLRVEQDTPKNGQTEVAMDDAHLAARIESALRSTGYAALRDIAFSVKDRVVHLSGRVPNFHLKQLAQESVLAIPGAQVLNDVDVAEPNS